MKYASNGPVRHRDVGGRLRYGRRGGSKGGGGLLTERFQLKLMYVELMQPIRPKTQRHRALEDRRAVETLQYQGGCVWVSFPTPPSLSRFIYF